MRLWLCALMVMLSTVRATEALPALEERVRNGDADAAIALARRLEFGMGVEPNLARAAELYCEAAMRGRAEAALRLAGMFLDGEGVDPEGLGGLVQLLQGRLEQAQPHELVAGATGVHQVQERAVHVQALAVAVDALADDDERKQALTSGKAAPPTTACATSSGVSEARAPASVTAPRTDMMYVVTEYGIVNLKGKSVPERAKALISIAHPDFREGLEREAYEHRLIPRGVTF
jgi:TPR repeat protein